MHELFDRDFEDSRDLAIGRLERRPLRHLRDDGMQTESADRNVDWRQLPEDAHIVQGEPDFLVGFPKGRALEGFSGIDDAARQGNLTAMAFERMRALRQHQVGVIVDGEEQQQPRRISDSRGVEAFRPLPPGYWRQARLRLGTWQFC